LDYVLYIALQIDPRKYVKREFIMKSSIIITGGIIAILSVIGVCIVLWLQPPQPGPDIFLPLLSMLTMLGAIYPVAYRNGFKDGAKKQKDF
jgi:hypothetical protein